jgi:hypothetical protein
MEMQKLLGHFLLLAVLVAATSGEARTALPEIPATAAAWVDPPEVRAAYDRIWKTVDTLSLEARKPIETEADLLHVLEIAARQRALANEAARQSDSGSWIVVTGGCRASAKGSYSRVAKALHEWQGQHRTVANFDGVIEPLVAAAGDRFPPAPAWIEARIGDQGYDYTTVAYAVLERLVKLENTPAEKRQLNEALARGVAPLRRIADFPTKDLAKFAALGAQ